MALAPAWAPPHPTPTPTNFCLPLTLYFNGLAAEGGGGEGYLSGKVHFKSEAGGRRGWERGVEDKIKISLPFLQCPKAREKKEQPAPTSKPGGGDAKQCGTPWHPSAAASEAAAAAAIAASTPLGGMERAEKRDGSGDPGRRRTGEQP